MFIGENPGLKDDILKRPYPLSPEQSQAVASSSRHIRVVAGAGAGKTETLTRRVVYLLLLKGVKPSSIVAFTFTEKAAQAMKSRIYQRVRELAGEGALVNLGEMYVGTIHSYALRMLQDHFGYGIHEVLDDNKEIAFVMRHGWSSLGIGEIEHSYSDSVFSFLRITDMVWDNMVPYEFLEEEAPEFYSRFRSYGGLLRSHKLLTFGNMIYLAVSKLRENRQVLRHVEHLIVDEYQDINPAQAELIRLLGESGSMFVVGDPRQCIYQWRGSDAHQFRIFSEEYEPEEISLKGNNRSCDAIVEMANSIAAPFGLEEMNATRRVHGYVGVAGLETPEAEAEWIADGIMKIMGENPGARYSDFGVLTRSVRHAAQPLIESLRRRGIPYLVGGKVGLFRRMEAQALGRIFAWFWGERPWEDRYHGEGRIESEDLPKTALRCWEEAVGCPAPPNAIEELRRIRDDLASGRSRYESFTAVYSDVLGALGFRGLDSGDKHCATVMANLGRFATLLTDYEGANRIGGGWSGWKRELQGLYWFMRSYAVESYEEQPSDYMRGVDAVQIMTVHQAKGLEWPVVFIFSMVMGRFPSPKTGELNWMDVPRRILLTKGGKTTVDFDASRYEGSLDDERRLFYVACTRGRDALVISHFRRIQIDYDKSPFLEELPPSLYHSIGSGEGVPTIRIDPAVQTEEIMTFEAGEIIRYARCPYMYLLGNVWGYQPEFTEALGYGKSVHFCIAKAVENLASGMDKMAAVSEAMKEFHTPYAPPYLREAMAESARRSIIALADGSEDDLRRSREMEYRIEFPSKKATIAGRIDTIIRGREAYEVRDYKTSLEIVTEPEARFQIGLYSAGLRKLGRKVQKGSLALLREGGAEIRSFPIDDSMLDGMEDRAADAIQGILERDFAARPGEPCGRCDQTKICRWRSKDISR